MRWGASLAALAAVALVPTRAMDFADCVRTGFVDPECEKLDTECPFGPGTLEVPSPCSVQACFGASAGGDGDNGGRSNEAGHTGCVEAITLFCAQFPEDAGCEGLLKGENPEGAPAVTLAWDVTLTGPTVESFTRENRAAFVGGVTNHLGIRPPDEVKVVHVSRIDHHRLLVSLRFELFDQHTIEHAEAIPPQLTRDSSSLTSSIMDSFTAMHLEPIIEKVDSGPLRYTRRASSTSTAPSAAAPPPPSIPAPRAPPTPLTPDALPEITTIVLHATIHVGAQFHEAEQLAFLEGSASVVGIPSSDVSWLSVEVMGATVFISLSFLVDESEFGFGLHAEELVGSFLDNHRLMRGLGGAFAAAGLPFTIETVEVTDVSLSGQESPTLAAPASTTPIPAPSPGPEQAATAQTAPVPPVPPTTSREAQAELEVLMIELRLLQLSNGFNDFELDIEHQMSLAQAAAAVAGVRVEDVVVGMHGEGGERRIGMAVEAWQLDAEYVRAVLVDGDEFTVDMKDAFRSHGLGEIPDLQIVEARLMAVEKEGGAPLSLLCGLRVEHTCNGAMKCLQSQRICDGTVDCASGTDEIGCDLSGDEIDTGTSTTDSTATTRPSVDMAECGPSQFTCSMSLDQIECIPSELVCDGTRDCTNGADEFFEECNLKPPPPASQGRPNDDGRTGEDGEDDEELPMMALSFSMACVGLSGAGLLLALLTIRRRGSRRPKVQVSKTERRTSSSWRRGTVADDIVIHELDLALAEGLSSGTFDPSDALSPRHVDEVDAKPWTHTADVEDSMPWSTGADGRHSLVAMPPPVSPILQPAQKVDESTYYSARSDVDCFSPRSDCSESSLGQPDIDLILDALARVDSRDQLVAVDMQ